MPKKIAIVLIIGATANWDYGEYIDLTYYYDNHIPIKCKVNKPPQNKSPKYIMNNITTNSIESII